jgi:nitrite reductase/ring-hydroxylating ferredoxin subunit
MPAAIRIDLCSTAEVAPGNALQVDKAGLVPAVFNQNGELFVTDDACTAPLARFRKGSSRAR